MMNKDYVFHVNWEDRHKQTYRVGFLAQLDEYFYLIIKDQENAQTAYNNGFINKIYTTNLTYIPEEIKNKEWLEVVDCTYHVAQIIEHLNNHKPISDLMNGRDKLSKQIIEKIEEGHNEQGHN